MTVNPALQPPLAYTWRSIQQSDIRTIQKMLAANNEIEKTKAAPSKERIGRILGMLGDQETIHFVKLLN